MKIVKFIMSWYLPRSIDDMFYMLQQVNYDPKKFISWVVRIIQSIKPLYSVAHRKELVKTKRVRLFKYGLLALDALLFIGPLLTWQASLVVAILALVVLPLANILLLSLLSIPVFILFAQQRLYPEVKASKRIFTETKATKIAVAGSYGKTTIKELLQTVLSEGLNVKATPGNMNTSVAHARFAKTLTGDEDILIIEYGEERPGDVKRYADITQPDHAIITGLAPNHLDYYKTVEKLANDIFSLRKYVKAEKLYVAHDSELMKKYIQADELTFDIHDVLGWKISSVELDVVSTSFVIQRGDKQISINTALLGRHLIPVVALTVALALKLGLSEKQIQSGLAKVKPHEHRMQPYKLHGAWVIDDTYNGNVRGMLAGLDLLHELKAKRKLYVTPGLVDQGKETESVHLEIAKKISDVKPDVLVLMKNSATDIIYDGLLTLGYKGKIQTIEDPLTFYTSLEQLLVPGDIVLMQNDWTDNYN